MNTIIFGTAGIPLTTPNPSTLNGILHLKTLDLDALELEFVKRIYLTENTAPEVAQAPSESDI